VDRPDALLDAPASRDERTLEIAWHRARGPWAVEVGSVHQSQSAELRPGQRLTLGSGRGADLRLQDRWVSARHCSVVAADDGLQLVDHCSTNGLFFGTARVREAALPATGGSFVVGRTTVTLRPLDADDAVSRCKPIPGVVGSSAPMRRIARDVRRYARLRAPVLLQGESGTGKDLIARALHDLAQRTGQYVPLNVGAIAESLADAELFGHRRGAFTGAVTSRAGAFEQADQGTLFLDEVAELSPRVQVKLLRVVEDGQVRPIGASQPVRVRVRIVSATWASLAQRVADGRFRPDLLHRLSTVVIELPPLRQRKSDIPALCHALLERQTDEFGPKRLTSAALARLVAYRWPGNVRELSSVLYRAAANSEAPEIRAEHIRLASPAARGAGPPALTPVDALRLLACHDGNVSAAARAAHVARRTFRAWLDKARSGSHR
jgi:DNA-binding NtrC family response regulator